MNVMDILCCLQWCPLLRVGRDQYDLHSVPSSGHMLLTLCEETERFKIIWSEPVNSTIKFFFKKEMFLLNLVKIRTRTLILRNFPEKQKATLVILQCSVSILILHELTSSTGRTGRERRWRSHRSWPRRRRGTGAPSRTPRGGTQG